HRGEGDELAAISGPAGLDRKQAEVDVLAGEDDLLRGAAARGLRERVGDRLQLLQSPDLFGEALRRLHLEHVLELSGDRVEARSVERHAHPALGAELIDQERMARLGALYRRARPAASNRAVNDLRDLEVRIDLDVHANKLVLPL